MKTDIVILNWNTEPYLRSLLPLCEQEQKEAGCGIWVVDNGSTDSSLDTLQRDFPWVRLLSFSENLGFTGGYNKALDLILSSGDAPEYVVLLNTDVEFEPGWSLLLEEWMDAHPDCAVCGPVLRALERRGDGTFSRSASFEYAGAAGGFLDRFGFPFCRGRVMSLTCEDKGQYLDTDNEVTWISGACMMVRSSVWRSLGGLDPRFFAHMEEIDFCWRAGLEGWKVCCVPRSIIYHIGGGSLKQDSPFKLMLNFRNSLLMLHKNLPRCCGALKSKFIFAFRYLLDLGAALVYLLGGKKEYCKAVFSAHKQYKSLKDQRPSVNREASSRQGGDCPKPSRRAVLSPVCIVLQKTLRARKVFSYLDALMDKW